MCAAGAGVNTFNRTLHRIAFSEKPQAPSNSWWAEPFASREAFDARAEQERRRMAGSVGEKAMSHLHKNRYAEALEAVS